MQILRLVRAIWRRALRPPLLTRDPPPPSPLGVIRNKKPLPSQAPGLIVSFPSRKPYLTRTTSFRKCPVHPDSPDHSPSGNSIAKSPFGGAKVQSCLRSRNRNLSFPPLKGLAPPGYSDGHRSHGHECAPSLFFLRQLFVTHNNTEALPILPWKSQYRLHPCGFSFFF